MEASDDFTLLHDAEPERGLLLSEPGFNGLATLVESEIPSEPSTARFLLLVDNINSMLDFALYLGTLPSYLFRGSFQGARQLGMFDLSREYHPNLGFGSDGTLPKCVAVKAPVVRAATSQDEQRAWEVQSLRYIAWELHCLTHKPIRESKYIARYLGIAWWPSFLEGSQEALLMPAIVMEQADVGTLNDILVQVDGDPLAYNVRWKLAMDVANGMKTLHSYRFIHGDLKAQNVLIFSDPAGGLLAKIADFGLAMQNTGGYIDGMKRFRGATPPWEASEMTEAVMPAKLALADIYSYGLLMWRIALNGRTPFDGKSSINFGEG
ncbi:kinase-like protein [Thozetella sp. PMI_491]|nr:kinase-like protein [Thozetella sp. PMI_491]